MIVWTEKNKIMITYLHAKVYNLSWIYSTTFSLQFLVLYENDVASYK